MKLSKKEKDRLAEEFAQKIMSDAGQWETMDNFVRRAAYLMIGAEIIRMGMPGVGDQNSGENNFLAQFTFDMSEHGKALLDEWHHFKERFNS